MLVYANEVARILVRQGSEQDGVDNAKHGGICTDTEGERENDDEREAGIPS
jgi:hypothetical protein